MGNFDLFGSVADALETGDNDPRIRWHSQARADQLQPDGEWTTWLVRGGRGSGKTHTGANTFVEWILNDRDSMTYNQGAWGIVGPTFAAAWTVCVEGESGLLAAFGTTIAEVKRGESKYVAQALRSRGEILLRNGDTVYVDSANDGADRVQGKNLKGVWCDELGMWVKWEQAWDESIKYAVRISGSRIIATTTPKSSRTAAKLIRRLLLDPTVKKSQLKTLDNKDNLSDAFIDSVVGRAKGTKLEKQELEGELIEDMSGALWTHDLIDTYALKELPNGLKFQRVVVGVDPSSGKESSDEQAYTVVGYGHDNQLYVLENWGDRVAVQEFIRQAILAAERWSASLVVEKNHGEGFLDFTIKQIQKDMGTSIPVQLVHASKGKRTRAEPIAGLYERGVVHHIQAETGKMDHALGEIEDQMTMFTGADGEKSPDRLDSLVWAVTPFLNYPFKDGKTRVVRKIDVAGEAEQAFPTKAVRNKRDRPQPWEVVDLSDDNADLSEWAPPSVSNVRSRVRRWGGQPDTPW
jgi:predicted phage terminase large subunit-like protein